jgi:hypothetical protein
MRNCARHEYSSLTSVRFFKPGPVTGNNGIGWGISPAVVVNFTLPTVLRIDHPDLASGNIPPRQYVVPEWLLLFPLAWRLRSLVSQGTCLALQ